MKFTITIIVVCTILLTFSLPSVYAQTEFKSTSAPLKINIRRDGTRPRNIHSSVVSATSPTYRFYIRPLTHQQLVPKSYALFIANETYDDSRFRDLPDATFDAKGIADTLFAHFGFQTSLVPNATYHKLETELQNLNKRLWQPDEQLLIYISGHGEQDNRQGYLIMKDSDKDDHDRYFSLAYLKSIIEQHACRHILLVLDICYGGAINQSTPENVNHPLSTLDTCEDRRGDLKDYFGCVVKDRTRLYVTSGSLSVVRGGKDGGHSPFAESLLKRLSESARGNDKYLLTRELKKSLGRDNPQLTFASEAAGDFLFVVNKK